RVRLPAGRKGVYLELVTERVAIAVVPFAEDAVGKSVGAKAVPNGHEATRIRRDRGAALITGCDRVYLELPAETIAVAVIPLAEDAEVAPVLLIALPDNDEVAARVGGDGRTGLTVCRLGVYLKLVAQRASVAVISLAKHAQRSKYSATTIL